MNKRTAEWFEKKLYDFFISKYADCDSAEFYIPPRKNQYVFDFPDRKQRVILTCSEDGSIEEKILQYTADDLAKSSKKIQRAEEKSLDYSDILQNVSKSGRYLPRSIETIFHEATPEEKKQTVLRHRLNVFGR